MMVRKTSNWRLDYIMILGLWGDDKTGKTTLALTFPKPLILMELDIGGFDRAKYRFHKDVSSGMVIYQPYIMPFQIAKLDLKTVRPSKIVVGMKELFYKFLGNYMKALEDDSVQTVVIDTGTLLWEIVCAGFLQEKQELQLDSQGNIKPGERLRVSLQQFEYKEPNIRMRGIIYQAKAHGKHLVLTHHSRDEYGLVMRKGEYVQDKTGKKERSGWTPLGDGADMIVHTTWKDGKPYCEVELSEVPPMCGMTFEEPSYEKIVNAMNMIRGEV